MRSADACLARRSGRLGGDGGSLPQRRTSNAGARRCLTLARHGSHRCGRAGALGATKAASAHNGSMALPHARPGQVVSVAPLGSRLAQEKTVALFKSEDLEVMRIVLRAGACLPPHRVPGEITIQCLEGEFLVSVDGTGRSLKAGELLYLHGGALHDLRAVQDSSALVTVALVKGTSSLSGSAMGKDTSAGRAA